MILKRRDEIEAFLREPGKDVRAALIHGGDFGVVRERAAALSKAATATPDDPFDVAVLGEGDLADDGARLEGELTALSMTGGRRLVRLRLFSDTRESACIAAALERHLAGQLNPDAFFLIEAPALKGESPLRRLAQTAAGCAVIACYSDEAGDLTRMARLALAADNVSLTPEAMQVFVARLPEERGVARQETERLVLYLGPGSGRTGSPDDSLTDCSLASNRRPRWPRRRWTPSAVGWPRCKPVCAARRRRGKPAHRLCERSARTSADCGAPSPIMKRAGLWLR